MEKLIIAPNKLLKSISAPVEFGADISNELNEMIEIVKKTGSLGLSAIQIGINKTFFVMNLGFSDDIIIVINPKIDYFSHKKERLEETCLSFPNKFISKNRSTNIHVEYFNEKWEKEKKYLNGIKARVFQHEYEHLIGKCIL